MITRIISGGQTGADRAALDVARKFNNPHGGSIPKGRKAEDGPLPEKYQLQEMPTDSYEARTEQNVVDSDGTLIIARGMLTGGTDYTRQMTLRHKKQLLGIDLTLIGHYDAASLVNELEFPILVTKRERPDFEISMGEISCGIEITEAIPADYARAIALAEREKPDAMIDMSLFKFEDRRPLSEIREIISQAQLTGNGWEGNAPEIELADAVRRRMDLKTQKLSQSEFKKYSTNILAVYDNMPLPNLNYDEVISQFCEKIQDYWKGEIVFQIIYVESGDIILELTPEGIRKIAINNLWRDPTNVDKIRRILW